MQFHPSTDTPADSPLSGHNGAIRDRIDGALDAARRGLLERARGIGTALRRHIRANSLVRLHDNRISVGIEVGDIGLGRLEPADIGA